MAVNGNFQTVFTGILLMSLPYLLYGQFNPQFPGRKTWWAKRVTNPVFVAGRLSATQIKFASEDGFASLVSIANHPEAGKFGSETLPSTADAKYIAEELSGLRHGVLCLNNVNHDDEGPGCWRSVQGIKEFNKLYDSLPKPVLVYSNTGYSAAFVALASLLSRSTKNPATADYLNAEGFYKRASGLGYDFGGADDLRNVVYNVSRGQEVKYPARVNLTIPNWHKIYWWAKPVDNNWYVTGQIQTDHVDLITELDVAVVMNARAAVSWNDTDTGEILKSQEEVNLLNINFDCSTYCNGGRQLRENLLINRIDPTKPSDYVSPESPANVNFWSSNPLEFGDAIGYNETTERLVWNRLPIDYEHTPIGYAQGYDEDMYEFYKETFYTSHLKGNVLAHCGTGYRAFITAVITVGQAQEKDFDWAVERSRLVGYNYNEESNPEIFELFHYAFSDSFSPFPNLNLILFSMFCTILCKIV